MYDDTAYAGVGFATAIMPSQIQRDPNPTTEVVPAAAGFYPGANYALSQIRRELERPLSPRTIELMVTDPAVSSSYNTHRMAILAGGVKLVSPVKQPAWTKRPQAPTKRLPAGEVPASDDQRSLTPEQSQAKDIHEFCQRSWDRLKGDTSFLFQLLDAMSQGSKLGEVTFTVPEEGPDAGKLVFDRITVKPNWAWRFVVDTTKRITGIMAYDPAGGFVVYPPDKFVWLSWMPKDSDPRGTSLFEAARNGWNLKMQTWPAYYKHLFRFGSPGLDFEMAADDMQAKPTINPDATLKGDGSTMDTGTYYATLLGVYQSGGTFCHPNGSKLGIFEPKSNGEAFHLAINLYNTEIKLAIEYQTRASLEAKHGSKADSETAENVKDLVAAFGRDWLSEGLFRAFKLLVKLNYGQDAADRYTSYPMLGGAPDQDRPALWTAAASLGLTIGKSQVEDLCDEVGLPIPDLEADAADAEEALQKQTDMMVKAKGDTSGTNDSGPPPKPKGKP